MEEKGPDKPLAVITGASSGIGYELAKQFAQYGYDLIMVSENPAIVEVAQVCRALGADVESYLIDLAKHDGVNELKNKIDEQARAVEAMAINTGLEVATNSAHENTLETELDIINFNVTSTVHLVRHIIKNMIKRKHGKILITSEVNAVMPTSLQAVSRASGAFIQTFSEFTRKELHGTDITLTDLIRVSPGINSSQNSAEIAKDVFQYMMDGIGHVEAGENKSKSVEGKLEIRREFGEPSKLKH